MADDYEEQGYDPGTSETSQEPSQSAPQESVNTSNQDISVPDEYGAVSSDEQQGPPDERGWVRKLVDDTRALFGIDEEAVPTDNESAASLPGLGQQQEDMGPASFDRQTGTAGGVRGQPREPTAYDQPTESARATGNVERTGALASGVAKNLFGADQPEAGNTMQKFKDYIMGKGEMPNAERKAREAQFAANVPPGTNMTKSDVREGALKQAAQEGLDKGSAMLQNYRVNQGNFRGLAAAALDHNDREGASKLWNEGHSFVPDGAHAIASPSANGIIMAVRNSATGETKSTMLTDNQFRDMLHNRSGEFDHLTDQGLQKMVEQVARTPGMAAPNQMSGAGVANTPGAQVPGQVGPTAAPPGAGAPPMQGAGVANTPGANIPQVGTETAQPNGVPLPQLNPTRTATPAPAAARGPSASDRADAILGRPAGTGQQERQPLSWRGVPESQQGRQARQEFEGKVASAKQELATLDPNSNRARFLAGYAGELQRGLDNYRQTGFYRDTNAPKNTPEYARGVAQEFMKADASKQQGAGRDQDGWPTGVPRGGQFANTKGNANRDFSTPISFGRSGHVASQGAAGSKPVYDAAGHTYNVDPKTGQPVAQQGQPGYRGPGPGQPNWTGTQSDKINVGRPEDRPQVIQRVPYAQQRADTNAQIKREGLDVKRDLGQSSLDVKREALSLKERQGTEGNAIKSRDVESKVDTRNRGVGVREQETARKTQEGQQRNQNAQDKLQFLRDQNTGKLNEQALTRLSRETNSDVRGVMGYIDKKVQNGVDLTPKEQQYVDMLRERTGRARQSP